MSEAEKLLVEGLHRMRDLLHEVPEEDWDRPFIVNCVAWVNKTQKLLESQLIAAVKVQP
jgi:hypothetical protein